MKIAYANYQLKFNHPFRLAHGVRDGTSSVFVRLSFKGKNGYGEATLPPYLEETPESVINWLKDTDLDGLHPIRDFEEALQQIHRYANDHYFVRCALEEALLDLGGYTRYPIRSKVPCTFTLGLCENELELQEKLRNAAHFKFLKLKLNSDSDRTPVLQLRKHSNLPFCVDANQAWSNVEKALEFTHWLKDQGAVLIEQPFGKDEIEKHEQFLESSPLPSIADESIQNLNDLHERHTFFSGVNVKLLKCGGPLEAEAMLRFAKEKNLFRLIGCMSESTLGVSHALSLSKYADMLDLDGPFLISNDPFKGYGIHKGKPFAQQPEFVNTLDFISL